MIASGRSRWLAFGLVALLLTACPQTTLPPDVEPTTISVSGQLEFDTGSRVEGAAVRARVADVAPAALGALQAGEETVTGSDGRFSLEIDAESLPVWLVVEFATEVDGVPTGTSKTRMVDGDDASFGTVIIPDPSDAEIPVAAGAGESADGSIRIEGLPAEVDRLFGKSYDPDETPEAFPGEFAENGQIPLESANFLWIEALDASGNPVDELGSAAVIRSRVPPSQWGDLEDIVPGSDRIEIPMYLFNEESQVWEQMDGLGWLEDGVGTVLPEDAHSVILAGSFSGDIFATFRTDHFSWMNVDYAYIGPWRLSLLSSEKRNNECLYNALRLAAAIALSEQGRAAFAKVNLDGADLAAELADNAGPALQDTDIGEYGVYKGDAGGHEDRFEMGAWIWDACGPGASERQKKDATLAMAVTILHETAHWKDDNKKHHEDDKDTPGEEGNQLERDLFGGIVTNGGGIKVDGNPVPAETVDSWLDPATWTAGTGGSSLVVRQLEAPLDLTLSLPSTSFALGEEVPVTVTLTNVSDEDIEVLDAMVLEGYPLHFEIVDQESGAVVPYLGPELKLRLEDSDFVTLEPGEELVRTIQLLRDPDSGSLRYGLLMSGTFVLTAVYEPFRGVPETRSDSVTFAVGSGGSISGRVTDASDGAGLAGAVVRVYDGDENLIATTSADATGNYSFPEFIVGTYTMRASAPGFLSSVREGVVVQDGVSTTVNFSLSQLLSAGQLRLVLRWGTTEPDLDSHLWLPEDVPFHVYYARKGVVESCPFAELDIDDTSYEGPETITIAELVGSGDYHYAIHNFSSTRELSTSGAEVQVFDSSGLLATFEVPAEGSGGWWHVLTIDSTTGAVSEVGVIGDDPAPYADTAAGCSTAAAAALERAFGAGGKATR